MKKQMSIELFKSRLSGQWHFRLVARNSKIVAQSEGYKRKASALKTIRRFWPRALLEEVSQ